MATEDRLGGAYLSEEDFIRLSEEPLFVDLLLLGRISNQLRFAHTAPMEVHNEGTPRAGRQLNNAFFTQVAFAIEALDTLKKLGPQLKGFPAWESHVVPIFRSPEIRRLESETVRDLRRKIVCHFERTAIEEGLARHRHGPATVFSMRGRRRMDVYFQLSDEVAISFLMPSKGVAPEPYRAELLEWLRQATALSLDIAVAAEMVAVDIGKHLGLRGEWQE